MRVISLSIGWTVVLDCIVWAAIGVSVGWMCHRARPPRFERDNRLTRLRGWERGGRWYERNLAIRRWKRWLPEAGDVFGGGFDKRHLRGGGDDHLQRFAVETRRAEVTHWVVIAFAPLFVLWNPAGLWLVMVLYALVANLPCLLVQRYNRARLLRILDRRGSAASRYRGDPGSAEGRP